MSKFIEVQAGEEKILISIAHIIAIVDKEKSALIILSSGDKLYTQNSYSEVVKMTLE